MSEMEGRRASRKEAACSDAMRMYTAGIGHTEEDYYVACRPALHTIVNAYI
jgi:hypothetical protein